VARLVTGIGAGAVVTRKLFAAGAAAYKVTLVDTERLPEESEVRVHKEPQAPALKMEEIANVSAPGVHAYTGVDTSSATVVIVTPLAAGQVKARLLPLCEKNTCVPTGSVPMLGAVNMLLDTALLTVKVALAAGKPPVGHAAVGEEPKPATAVGGGARRDTTCPGRRVPTAAVTTPAVTEVMATPVENVDTRKLPANPSTAYTAAPTMAAAFAGQATVPPPVSARVLPLCVKKSSVPAASAPADEAIAWVAMAVTETPEAPAPTTQKPGAHFVPAGEAELVPAGQK